MFSLPSGLYLFTVAVDADNTLSPRVSFGISFDASARPGNRRPVLFQIPESIDATPFWRIFLGI
jgi:hypothetical protein